MTTTTTTSGPAPMLPAAHVIARKLAEHGSTQPGPGNVDRAHLARVAELLAMGEQSADLALAEALRGVAHAIRPGYVEQRPETWLLCAVAHALRADQPTRPAVTVPNGDELSAWVDMLGAMGDELAGADDEAAAAPLRGSEAAAARAIRVQMLRLWLLGLYRVRVHFDAGAHLAVDAEGMPPIFPGEGGAA